MKQTSYVYIHSQGLFLAISPQLNIKSVLIGCDCVTLSCRFCKHTNRQQVPYSGTCSTPTVPERWPVWRCAIRIRSYDGGHQEFPDRWTEKTPAHTQIIIHARHSTGTWKCKSGFLLLLYLVQWFRTQTPEVPNHIRILQVSLRIPLLRVDEGRKLQTQLTHTLLILGRGSWWTVCGLCSSPEADPW